MNNWQTTADLQVSHLLIEQVLGQDRAVEIVRLAAMQRRSVLLVGEPGTGKSLLGRSMAQLQSVSIEENIVATSNPEEPCSPRIIRCTPTQLTTLSQEAGAAARRELWSDRYICGAIAVAGIFCSLWLGLRDQNPAYLIAGFLGGALFWRSWPRPVGTWPHIKVLYSIKSGQAPFVDATGLSAGALFGEVRHDPYQSGGMEAPPHTLIQAGAVHRAHGGILYIDEIGNLSEDSQRLLLTALQDKSMSITGRQQGSSGTMVHTAPLPCDFILVAAGNLKDLENLLPALRSRIRGFGYEILTKVRIPDDADSLRVFARFVAQEVEKDGRIPHFDQSAVRALIEIARKWSHPVGLSLRFRELGGLVRIAGDIAFRDGLGGVSADQVRAAEEYTLPLEVQTPPNGSHQLSKLYKHTQPIYHDN